MKKKLTVLKVVLPILGIIIALNIVYTTRFLIVNSSFEETKASMLEQSIYDNMTEADFKGGCGLGTFPINDFYYFWTSRPQDDTTSEIFMTRRKGWLGSYYIERFRIEEHFTTDKPIGVEKLRLRNEDNKKVTRLLIYSSNQLKIQKIAINLLNLETGIDMTLYREGFMCNPFACTFVLDTENVLIHSIMCYDIDGNLLYEYTP